VRPTGWPVAYTAWTVLEQSGLTDALPGLWEVEQSGQPVRHAPDLDLWLVSSLEACEEVLRQPELFSSRESLSYGHAFRDESVRALLRQGPGYPRVSTLVFTDPPIHGRYRELLEPALAAVTTASRVAPAIQRIVDDLIDGFAADGRCEFVSSFASPLPIAVIGQVLGVPKAESARLRTWSDAFIDVQMSSPDRQRLRQCAEAILDFEQFMAGALEARTQEPRDDLLTRLVSARDSRGQPLTEQELISLLQQLLVGGNETTRNFLGNAVWRLAIDHGLRDSLAANPRRVPRAAEEFLRLEAPLQGIFRIATSDARVAGTDVPAGAKLILLLGGANQDTRRFAPGFDLEHASAAAHLAFGKGIHACVGASLARIEIRIAIATLLRRLPGLRLEEGHRLERLRLIALRGFRELWVRFDTTVNPDEGEARLDPTGGPGESDDNQ
jgi:cytochrome P450